MKKDVEAASKEPTQIIKEEPKEIKRTPEEESFMVRQLGDLALKSLNNGESVKDEIVVHILVEKIRKLPRDKGFIIDGFPNTYEQTKLLEKALTGYDEDNPVQVRPKRESKLAPNPKPEPNQPKHKSSIDLIIYLNIDNETALKRSAGRFRN